MPRKEYKTITVKADVFEQFRKAIDAEKKKDPLLDNSTFLNLLVSKHKKTKKG